MLPAALRRRFGLEKGATVIAEAREDGILIRPVAVIPRSEKRRSFSRMPARRMIMKKPEKK